MAELAEVSTATVSHVINGTRVVAPETATRVHQAMRQLKYHPSAIARSLVTRTTSTLGLMVADITNPYSTALVRGVEDVASGSGFNIILCNTDEREDKAIAYARVLLEKRIDGLILAPTGRTLPFIQAFAALSIPIILVDRRASDATLPLVGIDNIAAAQNAVRHLIADGHQRIGSVSGPLAVSTDIDRVEGYRRALAEAGIGPCDELIRSSQGPPTPADGEAGTRELLALPEPPTAVIATNSLVMAGVLAACSDLGVSCPDDLAVIGFDDHEWAPIFTPPLTVVRQPTYEIGATAAALLLNAIAGEPVPDVVLLEARLVVRASCRIGGHPVSSHTISGRGEPGRHLASGPFEEAQMSTS